MAILHVEKLGGLGGYGGSRSHLRSRGTIDTTELSESDTEAVESLFESSGKDALSKGADAFRFRITRDSAAGVETIEVPEDQVPAALIARVKDELV